VRGRRARKWLALSAVVRPEVDGWGTTAEESDGTSVSGLTRDESPGGPACSTVAGLSYECSNALIPRAARAARDGCVDAEFTIMPLANSL